MSEEYTARILQQYEDRMFRVDEDFWFPEDREPEDENLMYQEYVDFIGTCE